ADPNCAGQPVFTTTRTVNGNGTYPTAAQPAVSFTPNAPGTYHWVASYSGDSPNTLPAAGGCGDANETSEVVDANTKTAPSGVNEAGNQHVFTVTINATPAGTPPPFFVNAIQATNPPFSTFSHTCFGANLQVNGNVATCTVTLNK